MKWFLVCAVLVRPDGSPTSAASLHESDCEREAKADFIFGILATCPGSAVKEVAATELSGLDIQRKEATKPNGSKSKNPQTTNNMDIEQ